jgi:hypothetical protein
MDTGYMGKIDIGRRIRSRSNEEPYFISKATVELSMKSAFDICHLPFQKETHSLETYIHPHTLALAYWNIDGSVAECDVRHIDVVAMFVELRDHNP